MRRMTFSAIAVFAVGCAYHPPHGIPTAQTRVGPAETFGLQITQVAGLDVDYTIDQAAYVVAIRVSDAHDIEVVGPAQGPRRSNPGHHYIRSAESVTWIESGSRFTAACSTDQDVDCGKPLFGSQYLTRSTHAPPGGYWLLIASDRPITNTDIAQGLGRLDCSGISVAKLVRKIPEAVIASRTERWAAYYAAFGETQDP